MRITDVIKIVTSRAESENRVFPAPSAADSLKYQYHHNDTLKLAAVGAEPIIVFAMSNLMHTDLEKRFRDPDQKTSKYQSRATFLRCTLEAVIFPCCPMKFPCWFPC